MVRDTTYRANDAIEVRIRDLSRVGAALDTIMGRGMTDISPIQFTATDNDLPANLITFSLVNAPAGAAIDGVTGLFTWTPSEAQGPGNYSIKVVATDNGVVIGERGADFLRSS